MKYLRMKYFRWLALWLTSLILTLWLGSCSTSPPRKAASLYVGAAGVFRDALLQVDRLFQQEAPQIVTTYEFAGAGLIKQRIDEGEPFDIFITAHSPPMDELQAQGAILPGTRKPFFGNQIALIVPKDSTLPITDFKDLTTDYVKTIVLASEKTSLGVYVKDVLTNLDILAVLQPKVQWVNLDQREVLKAVENREVDAGITFVTETQLSDRVKIVKIAPANLHRPINASLAVLKQSDHIQESKAFVNFLSSAKVAAVFEKYGFSAAPAFTAPVKS
jgi:molybdate transport system substrate-binding protein